MGDYLIGPVSTDDFNWNEKRKKSCYTYEQGKSMGEAIRFVDLFIHECNLGKSL